MSFLSTTRAMFSFVLLLYLFGFSLMMSRWVAVEQAVLEDECEPVTERRGDLESVSLLNINAQELPTVFQHDESLLKIDHDLPILNKDVAHELEESIQESKVKVPVPKTQRKSAAPVKKSGKKPLKEKTVVKTKANKGLLPMQKADVNENAKESAVVAKRHTKENFNPQKGNVPQKKLDQKSKAKANEGSLPTQKADVNENAQESAVVAKKHTKENLNPQKGNVPHKKLDQKSEAKVATKSKKVPAVKTNNAAQDKPKEEPPKPAKNPRQLRRGKRDSKSLWKNEQAKRRATLRQACDRLHGTDNRTVQQIIKLSKRSFWPFIVEDRYRLLYTYISKVGSTNWKSAFLVLQGKYKNVENVPGRFAHAQSLVKLSSLPDDEIQKRLNDYTNFIFVRHPFARVLSAYRSKFLQPNKSYQSHTGVRIIKMYRKNATKEALQTGSDVTFHEFVQSIVNSKVINFDGHWQPIYKMVLPCKVRFDFIGKLETGEEDAKFILEETKVDHLVHFMDTKRNVSHDDSIFNHFYSQIPSNDLVKLYKVYEPDFTLFGYEVPQSMKSLIQVAG